MCFLVHDVSFLFVHVSLECVCVLAWQEVGSLLLRLSDTPNIRLITPVARQVPGYDKGMWTGIVHAHLTVA